MADDKMLTAWQLIGFDGTADTVDGVSWDGGAMVRIAGGRALYSDVLHDLATARSDRVRLARLDFGPDGFRQVNRWVDPDALLVIVDTDAR